MSREDVEEHLRAANEAAHREDYAAAKVHMQAATQVIDSDERIETHLRFAEQCDRKSWRIGDAPPHRIDGYTHRTIAGLLARIAALESRVGGDHG